MCTARFALVFLLLAQVVGYSQNRPAGTGEGREIRQLVQVHAVVTDRDGKFVEGLTREDLVLVENSAEQPLDSVSMQKPDPQSAPRAIVLLVDSVHMTGEGLERVRVSVRQFIDVQKAGHDVVVFMTSSGKPGVNGEFMTDRSKLKSDLDRIRPGFVRSESFLSPVLCGRVVRRDPQAVSLASLILNSEERTAGSMQIPGPPNPEAEAVSKCQMLLLQTSSRRGSLMSAIGAAAQKLSAMPGQHIIALFTEGFSMTASGGDVAISDLRPAISSAVRAGAMIYAFDANIPLSAKQPNTESYSLAGEILNTKLDLQHGMGLLAGQTGGDASYSVDGLSGQLQGMLDANAVSYRLAYYPVYSSDPRKLRSLTVTVKGHPEYQVRAAKAYDMTDPRRK